MADFCPNTASGDAKETRRRGNRSRRSAALARTSAAALLALVSGCGGGDGGSQGGGSPSPVATTPAPTPPPPAAAADYPPAPFGIMAAQQFAVLGWHFTDAGADQVEGAPYAFGWGLSPDTYRISVPEAQGYLKYTFPGNNPIAFTVIKGDDGKDSGVKASVSVGRLYAEPYASTGWLTWYDDKRSLGDLLFGLATPAAALPASGSKRYRFDDAAQPWDLIIDFSARKVTGKVAVAWTDAWGPYEPGFYDVIDGQFEPATGKITGNFSVNGTALPGEIHGRLMGPKAGELALAVMGPALNPYDKVFQQTWFTRPGLECPAC